MLLTKTRPTVDIREAHNLWDILNSKYQIMEKILIYEGFSHDPDFRVAMGHIGKSIQKNIKILEDEMSSHSIPSPNRNRAAVQSQKNSDSITDEYMAMDLFLYYQEHIENLLAAFYSSITNDALRQMIKQMAARTIKETNLLVHYLRAKGWMEKPPMAHDDLQEESPSLSLIEAASLYDHLTYRYDAHYLTSIFAEIAHDLELRVVLELGLRRLEKQTNMLEKQLEVYAVPFPKRPGHFTLDAKDIRFFDDDTMFRTINSYMQSAGVKHTQAFKQATYNDDVRSLFKELLLDEMEVFDDFVKLGKVKGWLNPVPRYLT